MKRFTQLFTLTMTFLLISTLAQATVFETINGLKFSIDTLKNEVSLVAESTKYSGNIVVPEKITFNGKHYPVTSLGNGCFYCTGLTSIDIPSTVTSLGWDCFDDNENLTSIIFHIITSPQYLYSFKRYNPSICKLYLPRKSTHCISRVQPRVFNITIQLRIIISYIMFMRFLLMQHPLVTQTQILLQQHCTGFQPQGNGKQLGTVTSVNGTATFAVNNTGDIVIAKFGGSNIKIATK